MNREWLTASELAGMPGMPGTVRAIQIRAKGQQWRSRPRTGRGGGFEYHVTSFPKATRDYLLRQATAKVAAKLQVVETLPTPAEERRRVGELSDRQRETMQARLYVLSLIDEMAALTSRGEAVNAFVAMAKAGDLPAEAMAAIGKANARKGTRRIVDRATLYRWFDKRDKAGAAAVAQKERLPSAQPAWLSKLLAIYQRPMKPSVAACVRDWGKHYAGETAPVSVRTAQRHIDALPVEVREWGRLGRNARRAIQPFVRRTTDGLWPMDIVTVDGHLFKAYVRHPLTGRKMRPELTVYVDIATRRCVGLSAWLAESQFAIWISLRDMVLNLDVGIPALHYSDNGAYRGEQHRAVMARIGTSMMFSEAYRAQARGVIERFNSSVWVPLAKTHSTYCGKDADPEYLKQQLAIANGDGANLMAWADFIADCRRAIDDYNARVHSHTGKTPDQAWAEAVAEGWQPTVLADDDLYDLLPSEERKVSRGEISLPWGRYFADDLRRWHGQTVRVHINPADGARVWVSDDRGRLICTAERDGNARPYVHDSMLAHARAQREQGRVLRLERKLSAVREEGAAQINLSAPVNPELHAETVRQFQVSQVDDTPVISEDPRVTHARWMDVERRLAAGETFSADTVRGLEVYRRSPECAAQAELFELFELSIDQFLRRGGQGVEVSVATA